MHRASLLAVLLTVGLGACRTMPPPGDPGPGAMLGPPLERAAQQYRLMDESLPDSLLPRTTRPDGSLATHRPGWWTSGFFPGSLWYLYEHTGDPDLKARAVARTELIEGEKENASDHDIGFKINNSFGNALRITGDTSRYAPVVITAARTLLERFDPDVGLIRSWGDRNDRTGPYLVIIDNMMNLALLFRATELTGDSTFYHVAVTHADRTLEHHFRPDGSSYHVVEFDPATGEVLRKRTAQGAADSSAWARGQAWGLYGFTEAYRETGHARYLQMATRIADFILSHPNYPEDGVPYWDFDAPGIPETYRDASAGAITASALLELSGYVDEPLRTAYREAATTTLRTLSQPRYLAGVGENNHFILKHSVGHLPENSEVDVPLTYADYYFLEGLLRLKEIYGKGSPRS